MHIVDSSGWLEYFLDTPNANIFATYIEDTDNLLVPTIILYEVFKKILIEKGENVALQNATDMKQGNLIDLTQDIAFLAAVLGKEHKLPMADSIILATAQKHNAVVYTQDTDFKGIKGVHYFSKF